METIGSVARIHRFPVKSMQGEVLDRAELDENGIVGDRTWALRDVETDKLVSAKRPRLWRAMLDCRATGVGDDVMVELPSGEQYGIGDPQLPRVLSEFLGREVTIEASTGPMQGVYASDWPELDGISLAGEIDLPTNLTGEGTSFVDVAVLHLITTASLATLGGLVSETGDDIRRFRPSVLVETPELDGFAENEWDGRKIRLGEVEILVGEATPRCVMTTLAQGDLDAQTEVLRALATNNRVSTSLGTFASLGVYAAITQGGVLRAGDPVELG